MSVESRSEVEIKTLRIVRECFISAIMSTERAPEVEIPMLAVAGLPVHCTVCDAWADRINRNHNDDQTRR